jgi:hypothetical protein
MHNFKITEYTDSFLSWLLSVSSEKDRNRAFRQVTVTFFHILKHPLFVIQIYDVMASLELQIVPINKMQIGLSIK